MNTEMNVFQLIYTKVTPEESPWKKVDFHTVFYPIELLTKHDVFEIEKRIHFPQIKEFKEKKTLFYQRLQDKDYLVILHIQSLPEARDTFGRGGIFICHGFIFPEELWKKSPSITKLFELVKGSLFTNREDVLSSPIVDRKTGNIQALNIPEERLKSLPNVLPEISTEFEWKMIVLLNRLANMRVEDRPALLFKGEPESVSGFMNKLIAYIPDDYKLVMGYDPAFDNGNLTFYPIKIVGFKHISPTGGSPIRIDMETLKIEESPETSKFFIPYTPYERWLTYCRNEIVSKEQIEEAYNLSLILETETIIPTTKPMLSQRAGFVSINKEMIEGVFLKRCASILGETIARHLIPVLTSERMLDLIIEGIPPARLVKDVEDVILKNRLTQISLPESVIEIGSYRLGLIKRLWKEEALRYDDLKPLEENQRLEFIRYILLAGWSNKDWVLDILRKDREIFSYLLSSYETEKVIKELLLRLILKDKEFKEIGELILKELTSQRKEFDCLRKEIDFIEILEDSLKRKRIWEAEEIKRLILWAKKRRPPEIKFPYIKAFLYPRYGIPSDILKDRTTKERLLYWLIQYHGFKIKDLEMLGFDKDTLLKTAEQWKGIGWLERVKGILGLRRK